MVLAHQIRLEQGRKKASWLSGFFLAACEALLIFLGISLLLTGFWRALAISVAPWIYVFFAALSVYFVISLGKPVLSALLMPGTMLLYWYAASRWSYIQDGVFHLENAIISRFNAHYDADLEQFIVSYEREEALTAFFIFLSSILTFILAFSVVFRKLRGCWALCVVFVIGLCVWIGAIPELIFLLPLVMHCFLVCFFGNAEGVLPWERLRLLGFFLLFLTAVMGVSRVIGCETVYEAVADTDLRQDMRDAIRDWDIEKMMEALGEKVDKLMSVDGGGISLGIEKSGAGMSGGELEKSTNGIRFTQETHLQVTLPKDSGAVYLRGYIGARYDGSSWLGLSRSQQAEYSENVSRALGGSQLYTGRLIAGVFAYAKRAGVPVGAEDYRLEEKRAQMDIEVVGANPDYYYAPYDTHTFTDAVSDEVDTCLKPSGSSDYEVTYFYNDESKPFYYAFSKSNLLYLNDLDTRFLESEEARIAVLGYPGDLLESMTLYNEAYREYVRSVYLEIPAACSGVQGVLESTGSVALDVEMVCRFLGENYEYSLEPQPMERGEDYIEHFLFESKEGYCMHFASAGVMLFRSLGIPARYVEGYVVKESYIRSASEIGTAAVETLCLDGTLKEEEVPYVQADVPDSAAHAWVEIYLDNYGWYPIEVTAGYQRDVNLSALPTRIPVSLTPTPTATRTPQNLTAAPSRPGLSPLPTGLPTNTASPSQGVLSPSVTPPLTGDLGSGKNSGSPIAGIFLRLFFGLLAVSIVLLAMLSLFGRWKRLRKEELLGDDGAKKTLAYYREIVRLLRFGGVQPGVLEDDADFCTRVNRVFSGGQAKGDAPKTLVEVCRIAQKAKFSGREPEEAETAYVAQYYKRLRMYEKRKTKGLRRLWFRLTVV